ncbi:MAG: carbon-nitrogen hydrolase family protein [Candidatus Avigastranaerophilus sp.]
MKNNIKIAVVNFRPVWGDKQANLSEIKKYCKIAGDNNVNLILFPETCLTGYDNDIENNYAEKMHVRLAESITGESTRQISEIAKKYNMYVIFGMPEKDMKNPDTVYNSAAIIYPDGEVESYRKIHLPFDEKEWALEANEPKIIKSPWGNIGISICYDTYCFPELIRYYRAKGARLLLNVTACPDIDCTMAAAKLSLPCYAYINYIFIASSNLCGKDKRSVFKGGSSVIGPDKTGKGYKIYLGKFFGEKDADKEGIFIGDIDLSLADKNTDIPIFKDDWKPAFYKKLLEFCIE